MKSPEERKEFQNELNTNVKNYIENYTVLSENY